MKISDLRPKSIELELKHPGTNEPLGVKLTVIGSDTKEFQELQMKHAAENAEARLSGKSLDGKVLDAQSKEQLAACVKGWSDDEFFEGKFSKPTILKLLNDPNYLWLSQQLERCVIQRTAFFRPATK